MHVDTVATSTGTENEGALNGATDNEQTETVEEMDIGKSCQYNKCLNGVVPKTSSIMFFFQSKRLHYKLNFLLPCVRACPARGKAIGLSVVCA